MSDLPLHCSVGGSISAGLHCLLAKYDRVVAILRVPGGELYYEAEGDGVPVVLVHGLALDARMWDDQAPAVNDIARVVRYDVRGFGRSTRDADTSYSHADDLWRLLDHLEIDKAVLVGLSMGGRVVVEAALAAPGRVQGLVLSTPCSTACRGIRTPSAACRQSGRARLRWSGRGEGGVASPRFLRPRAAHAGRRAPARRDGRRLLRRELDERGPARAAPNSIELLATIAAPTIVVIAELDVPCFQRCPRCWPIGLPARARSRRPASGTSSTWRPRGR